MNFTVSVIHRVFSLLLRPGGRNVHGGQRVRQLRLRVHAAVAQGRHRTLSVQRVRPLPQDERHQQAAHQATETAGKTHAHTHQRTLTHVSLKRAGMVSERR